MRAFMAVVDWLPLVVVFAATVLLLAGCHEIGFRFAQRPNLTGTATPAQAVAIMSGVLALLSLMLAFTFSTAASRFEARRNAALDEVNAISTTWLRSRLLPVADAEAIEPLLRRYVDIRLEGAKSVTLAELERAIEESEALHEQMWRLPVALSQEQPRSIPVGLLVESLNELIDLHEKRVSFGLRYRVAPGVWLTLYFIGFIAMIVVGVHARLVGDRNLRVSLLLALGLSAAMTVTIDLDRPQQTLFGVNQDALMELKERLDNAASAAN